MDVWPNFFIVGAAKAGTTSLYSYLDATPGVYMSSVKEPAFFRTTKSSRQNITKIHDKSKYLKLFNGVTDEKAIGEASPSYLRDPETPKLIHDVVPDARIIILLRDPVQRAFSAYLMRDSKGLSNQTFHNLVTDCLEKKKKRHK